MHPFRVDASAVAPWNKPLGDAAVLRHHWVSAARGQTAPACLWSTWRETQFEAMLDAYRRSGGVVPAEELATQRSTPQDPAIAAVARWIVERQVVCFEWEKQHWLPLFQFCPDTLSPRPEMVGVVQELSGALDPWELALWFVRPNAWLHGRAPVNATHDDLPSILDAARASRFAVNG